jgi:hypothetical protein
MTPTRAQLATAHRDAGLTGSLDDALRSPLLARCLAIQAEAIERGFDATAATAASPASVPHPHQPKAPRHDFKRACAADMDD